jgi:hypothetical protein
VCDGPCHDELVNLFYELVITAIPFASMSYLSRGTGKDKVMSGFGSGPWTVILFSLEIRDEAQ